MKKYGYKELLEEKENIVIRYYESFTYYAGIKIVDIKTEKFLGYTTWPTWLKLHKEGKLKKVDRTYHYEEYELS